MSTKKGKAKPSFQECVMRYKMRLRGMRIWPKGGLTDER